MSSGKATKVASMSIQDFLPTLFRIIISNYFLILGCEPVLSSHAGHSQDYYSIMRMRSSNHIPDFSLIAYYIKAKKTMQEVKKMYEALLLGNRV